MEILPRDGWLAQELDACVVVVPLYEEGHMLGRTCWCEPRTVTHDPETGDEYRVPLVTHRDLLERETGMA